jgi:hypothetical protein
MAKSIFQKLFETVEKLGEIQQNGIHIIKTEEEYYSHDILSKKQYRMYHSKGYCIDFFKEGMFNEDTGDFIAYDYETMQEWEGFDEVNEEDLLKILTKELEDGKL